MQEMEIDLKMLLKEILVRWRLLLIGMLVGIVVAILGGGMMSVQRAEEAQQALEEQLQNPNPDPSVAIEPIVVPEVVYFSVKYVVVGIFLGIFAVAGSVSVTYVLSGKLKSVSDISQGFGLAVIGVIISSKKKRKFAAVDRFIEHLFQGEKNVPEDVNNQIIGLDICLASKKQGVTELCMTGNVPKEVVMPIFEKIHASEEKVNVVYEEMAIYSPEALKKMLGANGVVLFESVGCSSYADIEKEVLYCKRYGIPVLGCVVVE